jgi:hypothetical protein
VECDANHIQAEVVQHDFFTQSHASSSRSKWLTNLNQTLEECQILLCLQEADLEVQEVILVEEQVRGLHPPDGRDLSVKLEETRARVDGINSKHAAEVGRLSQLVMGMSNAIVDLGMLPVQDITQLLKSGREVLTAVGLIFECLREAQASSAG